MPFKRGGLVVSALDLGSRDLDGSLCVVFVGKMLYSHSASLHPGIEMGDKLSGELDKMLGGYLQWTSIPFRRSRNTPSRFVLRNSGQAPTVMSHSAQKI